MLFRVFQVVLFLAISLYGAEKAAFSSDVVDGFDARFKLAVEENKIPGAAYAIIQNGQITKVETYGVRALGEKKPVTKDTVFRLASVSKTYTAELAAILVAEGKLSWDARVVDYVPGFHLKTPGHAEKLKVSHILSHSSGLTPNAYDIMLEDGWSLDKIVPRFQSLKPICAPGKCYGYQNIIFSLIQPVIEKTTGEHFETLMEDRIFKPLGLDHTTIGMDGYLAAKDRAEPHLLTKKGWYKTKVNNNYYAVSPAAGVNANVIDLAKWVQAQMGYGVTPIATGVIDAVTTKRTHTKRELYRKVWKPYVEDAYYGYGWRIYQIGGEDIILHAGGVAGFRSLVSYSKDRGIGQVILMNAESRSIEKLGADFWTALISELPTEQMALAGR
ncbi:serine hydrolase domain-containing protein [Kordiimonas pumila]|uniref:Serine hydrolase domain-containing protein n=1 Tax=Kordiimonas pumila TaxID=2161677 RepID=A0ABV7D7W4_9PROT|nr:serine hydrolase domain-containing protein [Kordiimonas pumila]